MNIDEAIKIKEKSINKIIPSGEIAHLDADRLSLEALKQVKESRFDPSTWEPKMLPGETK